MKPTKRHIWLWVLGTILVVHFGCGTKVMVPPRIDLGIYDVIGLVEFSSNSEGNLGQFATQKFLEYVQTAQPGVRVLELGKKEDVLASISSERFDHGAVRAIGERHNVDAVIIGWMEVTDIKPKIDLSALLSPMSVRADVEAMLTAKLYETGSGATRWTDSVRGTQTVAQVTVIPNGPTYFDASNPEDAYGDLVYDLVVYVTRDFRVRYEKR